MMRFIYILILLIFANQVFSQIIDTCFINETSVYHAKNQKENSLLYWEITGGEIISENPNASDSVLVLWKNEGIQELSVYEKTAENCLGYTSTVQIVVIQADFDIELSIPNSFSPNGDRKNDYFEIKANYTPDDYQITIVNRWGNKVFESKNINQSWDGKNNIGNCQAGVYYYIIRYKNKNKTVSKKGFLHLFR